MNLMFIINYPFLDSKIPSSPAYGVYISQLIRYSRACNSYQDFLRRSILLTKSKKYRYQAIKQKEQKEQ